MRTTITLNKIPGTLAFVWQFVKFSIIGLANTFIDFSVYLFLTRVIHLFGGNIYIANTIAFMAAASFSLFANKRWTFADNGKFTLIESVKFFGTAATGFLLGTLTLFILVSQLGANDILAKLIATAVTVVWNFSLSKLWVFSNRSATIEWS